MANIASVLKDEIVRIARKELRLETEALKKTSSRYRSEIAELKRRVTELERKNSFLTKKVSKQVEESVPEKSETRIRFTAKGLKTQRQKLGLSAAELGKLLEVSAQTIYNWETESSRPRQHQMGAIAGIRGIGKKEAQARLAAL